MDLLLTMSDRRFSGQVTRHVISHNRQEWNKVQFPLLVKCQKHICTHITIGYLGIKKEIVCFL